MPFLHGNLGFERFTVSGFEASQFDDEHIELLIQNAAGKNESTLEDNAIVGFLGGDHVLDQDFDLSKNVIHDALHFGVRIDTNQVPSAIRNAWLQMELAGYAKDSPTGVPSKSQRKEAKEAVEQRCEVEIATGKYRKMQSFSLLWDLQTETLHFGGSVGTAAGHCIDLVQRTFNVECSRIGAGTIAEYWATEADRYAEFDDLTPASFLPLHVHSILPWGNEHSASPDFLGNEFLLWLWWTLENESGTLSLIDGSEATVMLTKTLSLECPNGESGKESISAESPVRLPEAMQAVRSGKLPRKTGMTLVRNDRTFDLVLQAETFGIGAGKIHVEEGEEFTPEDRIDGIRLMCESVDVLFHTFCDLRCGQSKWKKTLKQMTKWLGDGDAADTRAAA